MEMTIKLSTAEVEDIIRREIQAQMPDFTKSHDIEIKGSGFNYYSSVTVTMSPKETTDE